MSIGYAKHLVENMTMLGENNQGITLQPFELLDISRCIQELLDSQSAGYVCTFCGTTDPEKHRCPDYKDRPCTCEDELGHENCPGADITIESFKRALDSALTGEHPDGLTREELRAYCLGVITEEDFEKGMPYLGTFDSHGSMMSQMYITNAGRKKIEAVKTALGDWPDPSEESIRRR